MLDSRVRKLIDKPLDVVGKKLGLFGVTANSVTIFGFISGILSIIFIANDSLNYALLFLCLNRLSDGLDGAVASVIVHKKGPLFCV